MTSNPIDQVECQSGKSKFDVFASENYKDNKVRLYTNDANLLFHEKNLLRDRSSF